MIYFITITETFPTIFKGSDCFTFNSVHTILYHVYIFSIVYKILIFDVKLWLLYIIFRMKNDVFAHYPYSLRGVTQPFDISAL